MTDPLELRDELERGAGAGRRRGRRLRGDACRTRAVQDAGRRRRASPHGIPLLPEHGRRGDGGARGAALALAAARDALERAPLLPLRHGRHDPGRPRRRLADLGARPGRLRLGLLPARRAAGGDRGALAARAVRAARRDARACSSAARRWPTTPACSPPAAGGRSATGSTPTTPGSPARPQPWILTSGYIHASAVQAVGMLGLGRDNVRQLAARRRRTARPRGARARAAAPASPAIVIANAGEVNAGDFDPIADMASSTREHDAWLHVDGAFGLFARLSPRTRHLTEGVELADSITVDAHKWLNVPYDCGLRLRARSPARLGRALAIGAPYLPSPDDPGRTRGSSRPRTRAAPAGFAIWATLRAYGRDGAPGDGRAPPRPRPRLARAGRLPSPSSSGWPTCRSTSSASGHGPRASPRPISTRSTARSARRSSPTGGCSSGTTVYDGRVALRPAIVNWQTTEADVDLLIDVVVELMAGRSAAVNGRSPR